MFVNARTETQYIVLGAEVSRSVRNSIWFILTETRSLQRLLSRFQFAICYRHMHMFNLTDEYKINKQYDSLVQVTLLTYTAVCKWK